MATPFCEAEMTINGQPITFGESMTIRVACSSMWAELQDKEFREGLGEPMAIAYEVNLKAIFAKIGPAVTNDK